jgi:signal transduction histidine kinase
MDFTIKSSLDEQKMAYITRLRQKLTQALEVENGYISMLVEEWAVSDEMSEFLDNPTEDLGFEPLAEELYDSDTLHFVLITQSDRSIVKYRCYSKALGEIGIKQLKIDNKIHALHEQMDFLPGKFNNFFDTPKGPLLIASRHIPAETKKFGEEKEEVKGIFTLGRFVDKELIKKLSDNLQEDIEVFLKHRDAEYTDYLKLVAPRDLWFEEDSERMTILFLYRDVGKNPSFILKVITDDKLFSIVNQRTLSFITITALTIILISVILYFAIFHILIRRINVVSKAVEKIESEDDSEARLPIDSHDDEIALLIENINGILEKLLTERNRCDDINKILESHERLINLGRMASSVAHEINNPMLAISNCVQVIKKVNDRDPDLYEEAMGLMESEIQRIRGITSKLLSYHRWDKAEVTQANLRQALNESIEILKWGKKLEGVEITKDFTEDAMIYGSAAKLKQVFINFIINAVEATEKGKGKINLAIMREQSGQYFEVHLTDNGPGIPAKIKNRLFEPFVSSKEESGVGLGLYVAHNIIKNHNGEIIHDDSYMDGTRFIIKLPIAKGGKID